MTTAAAAVIEKGWSTLPARFYSTDGLQSFEKELTEARVNKLRTSFKASLPDLFERLKTQSPSEVLNEVKQRSVFCPSPQGQLIADLAEALRDGRLKRV